MPAGEDLEANIKRVQVRILTKSRTHLPHGSGSSTRIH